MPGCEAGVCDEIWRGEFPLAAMSTSSSIPLIPFLNSTIPLPRLRPTSGKRFRRRADPVLQAGASRQSRASETRVAAKSLSPHRQYNASTDQILYAGFDKRLLSNPTMAAELQVLAEIGEARIRADPARQWERRLQVQPRRTSLRTAASKDKVVDRDGNNRYADDCQRAKRNESK